MAALQQTPVTFQSRTPPSTRITATFHSAKSFRLSYSGIFPPLKVPKLTVKLASKTRPRGGAGSAKMVASAAPTYAEALADVAQSEGTLDSTSADVGQLEQILTDPLVRKFFSDPTIRDEKKRELVDEIVSSGGLQPHTANFLNILVDMKRIDLMKEIAEEFENVYNKMTKTEVAIVSSVVPLESQHLTEIAKGVKSMTEAENVRIKTVIDPSLIAGLTIRFGRGGSKLIDMSVKKQILEIASELGAEKIKLDDEEDNPEARELDLDDLGIKPDSEEIKLDSGEIESMV